MQVEDRDIRMDSADQAGLVDICNLHVLSRNMCQVTMPMMAPLAVELDDEPIMEVIKKANKTKQLGHIKTD